jgi:hypothetical protein
MSLYEGKLYLYWGPLPALLLTPIQFFVDKKITDNYFVFFFSAGLLVINSLIILKLWRKFFMNIPAWNVFVCIPLIGLISPIPWIMNVPNIYEAATAAGQFFLLGGIFFIISALEKSPSPDRTMLFLAGSFLVFSVASRALNTLSVIFLAACVLFYISKNLSRPIRWGEYIRANASFFAPLIIGAAIIGWYNWARFDSPFEFGLRYQITILDLNKQMNLTFQPDYFLLNLYGYILQPFEIISGFPFIRPISIASLLDKLNIATPKIYAAGRMTGLLFSAPFLVLSLVNFSAKNKITPEGNLSNNSAFHDFVVFMIAGSFLINLLNLLFFFFSQMRYLVDAISQFALLAIIGYWKLISLKQEVNSKLSSFSVTFANLLIVLSICIGLLLAFSGENSRFETLNPLLFGKIGNFLTIQK